MAELYKAELPDDLKTLEVMVVLVDFAKHIVRHVAFSLGVAAQRGCEQAAELINDPEYYLTVKQRRKNLRESVRRSQERQEAERREREQCPTAEQIAKMRKDFTEWAEYHEKEAIRFRQKIEGLPDRPRLVRMPAKERHETTP